MSLAPDQREKIAIFVKSYLHRTAELHGHKNAEARASARWTHTLSVVKNIIAILDGENANELSRDICVAAAFFHDVDHYTVQAEYHAQRGAETARHFLKKEGYHPEFINAVSVVIRGHDLDLNDELSTEFQVKALIDSTNIETRMLIDADTLDKIGVANIMQSMMTLSNRHAMMAEIAQELASGWPLQRASLWKEFLTTATGKKMGEARFAFYKAFLAEIKEEIVFVDEFPDLSSSQELRTIQQYPVAGAAIPSTQPNK